MDTNDTFDAKLSRLLRCQGVSFASISRKERWSWQQRWRECFCAELKTRTGKWTQGGIDYSTFLTGKTWCLWQGKALRAYATCSADDFLVIPAGERDDALRCYATHLPNLAPMGSELYVFPPSLDWTMVFSCDGPIFAKREWLPMA